MSGRLSGRSALVTGAAGGIGLGCARAFAAEGCDLVLLDLDEARVVAAAQDLARDSGRQVHALACDLADAEAARMAVIRAAALLGRIDILGGFAPDGTATVASVLTAVMLVFSLLLADFFDTMGTVVAIGAEGNLLNEKGEPPHLREILLVDSLAALAGGAGSASSNTSYIESTAGVAEGARTGLASVVTGAAFLLALFLTPLVNMVPSEAVAPILLLVGMLMMMQIVYIDWQDFEIAFPAFVTIVLMPFTYSITAGIGAGFIMYVAMKVFNGKAGKVHALMWVVAALFVVYFTTGLVGRLIA